MRRKIPLQLKENKFKFILLKNNTKIPMEEKWTSLNNYNYDDDKLLKHIENNNYGILCGNGLAVLDLDNLDIINEIESILPSTFTVETGSGKRHYYFIVNSNTPKIIFDKTINGKSIHFGELQSTGAQVVGPSSIHPDTGEEYKIIKDDIIANLTTTKILALQDKFKDIEKIEVKSPDWSAYDNISNDIKITELVNLGSLKPYHDEYYGTHPIHGSDSGMNFFINPNKNLWHCFRHNSGGDALSYIAMKEGICQCGDFSNKGKLRGDAFKKTLSILKEKYGKDINKFESIPVDINILNEINKEQLAPSKIGTEKKVFYTDEEFDSLDLPDSEWLVDKWIAKGDICFIAGKASSFKTTISLHMAYSIAEGKPVFNSYETKKLRVLYINEENHAAIIKKFIKRIKNGLDMEKIKSDNLFLSNMENFKFDNLDNMKLIANFINKNKIDVVFFDSFRRFFIGKENEADVISKVFEYLKALRTACNGISIVTIHHVKKNSNDPNEDIRDILRGSSDIVNSADSILAMKRKMKQTTLTVEHIKNRSGPEIAGKVIKIEGEEEGKAYIYEIGDMQTQDTKASKPEECANKILAILEEGKVDIITRKDLNSKMESLKYSYDTITKGLRILKDDGLLIENNAGRYTSYSINKLRDLEKINKNKSTDLTDF